MVTSTSSQKVLWVIFLTILLDMLGMGILIPVFPLLVVPSSLFKVTPSSWSTGQGFIMIGWLMASFPLLQFFCTPLLGQLADKYGRRKILAFSISGTAFSYLLFAIALITKNIPLMFISRILDGASGGNISVAQAVIGDISNPSQRAKNFGLVGVAIGIGFVLGPFFGGKLSDPALISWFNVATPFWFAAILSIINVILVLKSLPETFKPNNNQSINITRPINNILKAFSINQLRNIIPSVFLFNAGFTFFTTFWGVILADKYGFSQSHIGNYFAYVGLMIILAQGLVVRRLSGKVIDYKILRYSIFGTGICLIAYYCIPVTHVAWVYFLPPFLAICVALTKAFSNALITRITPSEMLGEVMGINSSAAALAQAIPALLAGYLASHYTTLPILAGAITAILAGILFKYMFKANG